MSTQTSELILRLRDGVTGPAKVASAAIERLNKAVASSVGNRSGLGMGAASAAMKRQAEDIARSVRTVEHSAHAMGAALAGLGIGHGFGEFIKAGADYRKELIALQNSGKTSDEIARSMKAAANIATALPTQTFADSIKIINETTAAYGDLGHALENLEFNSKFESNMKSALGAHAGPHMLNEMVRALEIRGTAFNPHTYQEEAAALGKAFAFTRGNVNPQEFLNFAQMANPALKNYSKEYLTEIVPTLIQTFGGHQAGTMSAGLARVFQGNLSSKSQAAEWVKYGFVPAKAVQDNKGQAPGWKAGQLSNYSLAMKDPLAYVQWQVEQLTAKGVDTSTREKLGAALANLYRKGVAQKLADELGQRASAAALRKDQRLIRGSATMDEQYENNRDDIYKAKDAVRAAFENLMASMSGPLITSAAHGLWSLAKGVQGLAGILASHPLLGKGAGVGVSLGAAAAGVAVLRSGFVMLGLTGIRPIAAIRTALISVRVAAITSATWMGRSFLTLLNPLNLVRGAVLGVGMMIRGVAAATGIGALAAAGAIIYENWDNIRVAVEAFRGAFMRAIEPVRPVLQPIITDLSTLWETIVGLVHPTGDMGDEWAKVGINLGKVLGQDLVPWAQSIRNAYEEVKSLGTHWGEVVTIITSDDAIGRAVTALAPKFNAMVADAGRAIRDFDWGAAWMSIREKADPVLTEFFTGWVAYAKKGADALLSYDWAGLGTSIVQAIIAGIQNMGSALGDKLKSLVPFSGSFLHGGAGDDMLMDGAGASGAGGGGRMARTPGNPGEVGWWTKVRQDHAVDVLTKEGVSPLGAEALISRWKNVEAPGGPSTVNSIGAQGIAQWLGARKNGVALGDFDGQLKHAAHELHTSHQRALGLLNSGSAAGAATGASDFERAEGYNARTGTDNFTRRTLSGMRRPYGREPAKAGDTIMEHEGRARDGAKVADARGGRGAGPVHIENHFHDVGHKDERQLAGYVADTFHQHAHASAAGNFADVD